jgi:hypothetical protein
MLFGNPSLFTRIVIGKGVGFALGIIGFFMLPILWPGVPMELRIGFLFWYATVGAMIAVFGVVTWHPVLHIPMPWWFRAPLIGAWMNLLIVLIAHGELSTMMMSAFGAGSLWNSVYWLVLEGALVGLLIGGLCTKFGGEGKATVDAMSAPD